MKNWVYLIRREYVYKPKDSMAVGGSMEIWYSLQGWVDKRRYATAFSKKSEAESEVLILAAAEPSWIGQLSLVRLTRRKGMTVDA